jgi:hypothetical protein
MVATSSARFFFEGGLCCWIGVGVPRTGTLRTHPEPLEVVVAPLRCHVLAPGLLRDPARNGRAGPQAAAWCWSRDRRSQFLLLLRREERRSLGGDQLEAVIPQARRTVLVVPAHDAAGVIFLQPDEGCGVSRGLAVSDEGQELPAPCLHHGWGMAGTPAQFGCRHVRMEVGGSCHAAA